MKHYLMMGCFLIAGYYSFGQNEPAAIDSSEILQEVVVRAYENNRRLIEVPVAVSIIGKSQLNRFNNISILPALNSQPGIRMEERSPGSYRLNIRGSSLRSPFGVRNVKVYYNGIPYTDPGGNTFLNQLGYYNIQSIEVIKGPGSSLYGAGTGGVMLLTSDLSAWNPGITIDYSAGSFNSRNVNTNLRFGSREFQNTINYLHQQSDGYRDHTESDRKVFTWDATASISEKGKLHAHLLYGDLFYETPGALTANEYNLNPKAARPRTGPTPSSAEAKAAINTKMFLAGFSFEQTFNDHWKSTTSLYGAFTQLKNPTTRNYERKTEPHTGGRSVLEFSHNIGNALLRVHAGGELQQGFSTVRVARNNNGNPDSLQTEDEINNRQFSVFVQATTELAGDWILTAGVSVNQLKVSFTRLSQVPALLVNRTYENEVAPRIAILKKLQQNISLYASVSKGFSPPTTAELLPSTSVISTGLEAEQGLNYEVGTRGSILKNRLYFDVNAFIFRLTNTIAQRRDATGGDFFENAGSTRQHGIESFLSYTLTENSKCFMNNSKIWASHTWHNFHYDSYTKVLADTTDFSHMRLPSIAPHVFTAGLDINTRPGLYTNITYYYSDPVPLNDANTDYASSFNLLGARVGFRKTFSEHFAADVFGTVDNIFNVKYSLGNDINAFGGRYYNAAPGINYMVGASLKISL